MSDKPPGPPSDAPSADKERPTRNDRGDRFRERMDPEVRKKFDAAREKALKDPELQQLRKGAEDANKKFFEAMRKKMVEIDPSLAEFGKRQSERAAEWRGYASLSDKEREQLRAARNIAKQDPAVQEAEKKRDSANTPEERKAASDAYRKAIGDAMLKADPSLAPVLEKLKPGASKPPAEKPAAPEVMAAPST